MTARQWAEWLAYHAIEPWGELRADFRSGQIAAAVANYAGKTRSEDAPLACAADFMPALREFGETTEKPARREQPILLPDPVEHSQLIRKHLFKEG